MVDIHQQRLPRATSPSSSQRDSPTTIVGSSSRIDTALDLPPPPLSSAKSKLRRLGIPDSLVRQYLRCTWLRSRAQIGGASRPARAISCNRRRSTTCLEPLEGFSTTPLRIGKVPALLLSTRHHLLRHGRFYRCPDGVLPHLLAKCLVYEHRKHKERTQRSQRQETRNVTKTRRACERWVSNPFFVLTLVRNTRRRR